MDVPADTTQVMIQFIDKAAADAALWASDNRSIRLNNLIVTAEPYRRREAARSDRPAAAPAANDNQWEAYDYSQPAPVPAGALCSTNLCL